MSFFYVVYCHTFSKSMSRALTLFSHAMFECAGSVRVRLWRGAVHTRWSAATQPAVVAASWFAGTGAPDSCWVTNHRGGVTHRVHSQLTYPYRTRYPYTRARDPLTGLEVPYKCAGGALPLPLTSERG